MNSKQPGTAWVVSATNQSQRRLHYREDCQSINQGATARAVDPTLHPGRKWCRLCDPDSPLPNNTKPNYGECPVCGERLSQPLGSHLRYDHD